MLLVKYTSEIVAEEFCVCFFFVLNPPQCVWGGEAVLGPTLLWHSHPVFSLMFSTCGCEIQCLTSFLNIESPFFSNN